MPCFEGVGGLWVGEEEGYFRILGEFVGSKTHFYAPEAGEREMKSLLYDEFRLDLALEGG